MRKKPIDQRESKIPLAPPGVNPSSWERAQLILISKGMPKDMVYRLRSLRQMNLYSWLVGVLGHEWKWVMDNEEILIDKNFKRKPGQA